MRIDLKGNFVITSDAHNFILSKKKKLKDNKEKLISHTYHSDIESVLNAYVQKRILGSDAKDIKTLLKDLNDIYEYIKTVVKSYKGEG